jgi:hypothetical protein
MGSTLVRARFLNKSLQRRDGKRVQHQMYSRQRHQLDADPEEKIAQNTMHNFARPLF